MVPNGWSEGRVGDLLDGLESGVSVNGEDRHFSSNEKAVLKVSAVTYGSFNPFAAKVIDIEELDRATTNPKQGQVIISRSNTESLVGASAYIERDYPNLFLPDKLWQTVPKANADMKWLSYILASSHVRYMLSNLATGTSGSMKNITKGELLGLKILIPPSVEQKKISQTLSTWDKAISTAEQLLTNSQQQKKVLMQQLLTGKKRLLDNNGVRFSRKWESYFLGDWLQEFTKKSVNNDQYEVLTSSRSGLVKQSEYFADSRIAQRDNVGFNIIPPGYITYRSRSDDSLFFFNRNDFPFTGIISTYYPVFNFPDGDTNFFLNLLNRNAAFFSGYSVGTSQKVLSLNALKSVKINLPESEEQQKIAAVLFTADKEITILQQQLDALKQEKKALMQQLLTGKRRVKIN
ncbi:restriction endonuclease subunit S [Aeromonas hydrophila]